MSISTSQESRGGTRDIKAAGVSGSREGISRRAFGVLGLSAVGWLCGIETVMAATWKYSDPYIVSADDILWFRGLRAQWLPVESGAPGIVVPETDPSFELMEDSNSRIFRRYEAIVCAFFFGARFTPGTYELAHPVNGRGQVMVSENHLRLLRFANWRYGIIDGKRPYGSYTDYPVEMAKILGWPVWRDSLGVDRIADGYRQGLEALHHDLTGVIQAYIEHAQMAPGPHFIPANGFEPYVRPRLRALSATQRDQYRARLTAFSTPHSGDAHDRWRAEVEATNLLFSDLD